MHSSIHIDDKTCENIVPLAFDNISLIHSAFILSITTLDEACLSKSLMTFGLPNKKAFLTISKVIC